MAVRYDKQNEQWHNESNVFDSSSYRYSDLYDMIKLAVGPANATVPVSEKIVDMFFYRRANSLFKRFVKRTKSETLTTGSADSYSISSGDFDGRVFKVLLGGTLVPFIPESVTLTSSSDRTDISNLAYFITKETNKFPVEDIKFVNGAYSTDESTEAGAISQRITFELDTSLYSLPAVSDYVILGRVSSQANIEFQQAMAGLTKRRLQVLESSGSSFSIDAAGITPFGQTMGLQPVSNTDSLGDNFNEAGFKTTRGLVFMQNDTWKLNFNKTPDSSDTITVHYYAAMNARQDLDDFIDLPLTLTLAAMNGTISDILSFSGRPDMAQSYVAEEAVLIENYKDEKNVDTPIQDIIPAPLQTFVEVKKS